MGLQQALGSHAAFTEGLTRIRAQVPGSEVMCLMRCAFVRLSAAAGSLWPGTSRPSSSSPFSALKQVSLRLSTVFCENFTQSKKAKNYAKLPLDRGGRTQYNLHVPCILYSFNVKVRRSFPWRSKRCIPCCLPCWPGLFRAACFCMRKTESPKENEPSLQEG